MPIWQHKNPSAEASLAGMPTVAYSGRLNFIERQLDEDDEPREQARAQWVDWLASTGRLAALSRFFQNTPFCRGCVQSLAAIQDAMDDLAKAGFDLDQIDFEFEGDSIYHCAQFPDCIAALS